MITIIIHKYKKYKITKNIKTLWFISIVKWNLLDNLEKGIKMYKELKQDYKILQDLSNNQINNGNEKRNTKRENY